MSLLLKFDLEQIKNFNILIGVDEAGRGAFAGDVVAAAVSLKQEFYLCEKCKKESTGINDSKQISADDREKFYAKILDLRNNGKLNFKVGSADVNEIEQFNIVGATKLAMSRALKELIDETENIESIKLFSENCPVLFGQEGENNNDTKNTVKILIDGKPLKNFQYHHTGIVKGDGKSLAIAMGSIIAKVSRDRKMITLDKKFPEFGFSSHKGYGTKRHIDAIKKIGPLPIHRKKFLRNIFPDKSEQTLLNI